MKRTVARLVLVLVLLAGCGLAALTAWFIVFKPARTAPASIRVEPTPERIARGKYLFALAGCDGCHSERDFSLFAGPVVEDGRGHGTVFPPDFGLPGTVVAPNITSHPVSGIGGWTDGEKIRAIRDGIGRDGRALFPLMPYRTFRYMSDSDVQSLVAYLNTLPPDGAALPRTRIEFPASLLLRLEPQPAGRVPDPDRRNPVAYGGYLAGIAGCVGCHSPLERGSPRADMRFAGGREFRLNGALVVSANITPDPGSGIGKWSEHDFLERFYQYRDYDSHGPPAVGPEGFTIMPWLNFSRLQPEDLKAIWQFLRTRKPVYHPVETRPVRASD